MLQSRHARTGLPEGEPWAESSAAEIDAAAAAAEQASAGFASTSAAERAALLRVLADSLEGDAAPLAALADRGTALGLPHLRGEIARTCFQLRGFADALDSGVAHAVLDEPAVAGAPPAAWTASTRT